MPQGTHSTLSTPSQSPLDERCRDALYFDHEHQMGFPISTDREAVIELLTAQRSRSAEAKTAGS